MDGLTQLIIHPAAPTSLLYAVPVLGSVLYLKTTQRAVLRVFQFHSYGDIKLKPARTILQVAV